MWMVATVLALVALGLGWTVWAWVGRMQRAHPPAHPAPVVVNGAPAPVVPKAIPKVLWTYWHPQPPPDLVQRCWANWPQYAPDHEVRALDRDSIKSALPNVNLPERFDQWPAYRQADWSRLRLLAEHGGIWMDASNFLTRDLNWLHEAQQQGGWEYAGYYINAFTRDPARPIVENWFMACVPGSAFVMDLCQEFEKAMNLGEKAYLASLKASGEYKDAVQGLKNPFYLVMHACASIVQKRNPGKYRIGLWRAEDSAFAYQARLRWSRKNLYIRLGLLAAGDRVPPMVKIRGGERDVIAHYDRKGWIRHGSLIDLYLPAAKPPKPTVTL